MDIDVDGLADAEWAVIAKKIQSSLHYWLDKTVRVGELQVYFDAQEKRNRLKWPAALKNTWSDGVAVMRREGEQRLEDLPHCPRTPDNAVPLFRPIDWDSTPVSLGTTSKYSPVAVVTSPPSFTVPLNRVVKGPWGIIPRLRSESPYSSRPAKQQPGLFQVPIDNDALVAPRALDKTEQALVDMFTTNQRAQDDELVRRAYAFPARDSPRKYYVAILTSLFHAQDPPTRVWHAVTEILKRSALDDDAAEERLRPLRARERRLQAALKLSGATSSELRAMVRAMTDRHRDERRMHLDSLLWWLGSTAEDEEAR
ncbi:hypothetical protein ColLi_09089 [Colletotrichum liriopes]|uniref:Uncharacterized protein n=1 Tax=Colletotrichum liriopes TaxID=708192 RepID=A0AA37GS58_9PEZI|nr:hypothetical protein ColLi_09089 [Colletotrichum liriopes]